MSEQNNPRVLNMDIEEEMKKSFISYAMAVIINRALPDVRDGLKPVQRRILYAMQELGLSPDKPFRKCARIVGDTLGKYHPHGDSSVYDAMVRMAQDFSTRYPLVQGHGNFGSVDGDSAAAMRYTEARMSRASMDMLTDIDKDTVDFGPNFDETLKQPLVLPARFPNLLVNGSGGIAVGMATNIPPHNMGETCDAVVALLENPELDNDDLMEYVKGPDFPTGGLILGTAGIKDAYRTGRGRIVVRARAEIDEFAPGRGRIIVTELPYQVNKARLVEKIADLVHEKKLEGISDLREESDRAGMRIVIELKKDVNPTVVLNALYKHTQMQDTFGVIMLALVDGTPRVLTLREMLSYYIAHQVDVILRRTRYDLSRAEARAHIVEGLIIALDHIDEVIAIIRASRTAQAAREQLMERFGLSDKQAQAILDMRLQRLTGLEYDKVQEEYKQLKISIEYYKEVLASDEKVRGIIKDELLVVRNRYNDPRRSEIVPIPEEIDLADLIDEHEVVISRTHNGYIKRQPVDVYRSQNRGGRGIAGHSTREEDFIEEMFTASTHAPILFFTSRGRAYSLFGYDVPEASRTAQGMFAANLLPLESGEKITAAIPMASDDRGYLLMATRLGVIKKTQIKAFDNMRKTGLIALFLNDGDDLISVVKTDGDREILLVTRQGMSIRFHEEDVREMGRAATGVRGIRLEEGDEVVGADVVREDAEVLIISERGFGKRTKVDEYNTQSRGGKGVRTLRVTEKTGFVAGMKMVTGEEDVMLIAQDGTLIRMQAGSISSQGRNTQGVTLMRLDEGTRVAAIALTGRSQDEEE